MIRTRRQAIFATLAPLAASALMATVIGSAYMPSVAYASTSGSGKQATESRTVAEFQGVALSASADMVVRQGAQQISVTADDNLLPLLETVIEPGKDGPVLHVRWKKGTNIYRSGKVLVQVSTPKLQTLAVAGSGDVKLETFTTPVLNVSIAGSGDARLEALTTDDLGVRISGSGDIVGKGSAGKLNIGIAGSGGVKFADLRADDVKISIAGSGDAAVNAQKTLAVSIAGSGDVTYTGNPSVKSSVAGSGSVTKK